VAEIGVSLNSGGRIGNRNYAKFKKSGKINIITNYPNERKYVLFRFLNYEIKTK
jgi:hypothetical protein